MITAIIETKNDEVALAHALAALVPAATEGMLAEVVVVDHESEDGTLIVADAAGCTIVRARTVPGDPRQFAAENARGAWLLFLAPTTILRPNWSSEAGALMSRARLAGREAATILAIGTDGARRGFLSQLRVWKRGPHADRAILVSRQLFIARAEGNPLASGYLLRPS